MADIIVAGADEAGRGLIIGPLVIGACTLDHKATEKLKAINILDSKKYSTNKKLFEHAEFIKKNALAWSIQTISAEVLNNFSENKMTIDEVEAYAFYRAIEDLTKKTSDITKYQVDNFQAVKTLEELLAKNEKTDGIELIVIPRAETKYYAVRAGSILARAESLAELDKIRSKYGQIGSGSTNDKKTIQWLEEYYFTNKNWPKSIVRTSWKTIANIEKKMREK